MSALPAIRLVRHARTCHDLAVLFVFADQVAVRLGRSRDHLIAVGLQSGDFGHAVDLKHQDGSRLYYRYAFLVTAGDHRAVFTEHQGYHVFHAEDLVYANEQPLLKKGPCTDPPP